MVGRTAHPSRLRYLRTHQSGRLLLSVSSINWAARTNKRSAGRCEKRQARQGVACLPCWSWTVCGPPSPPPWAGLSLPTTCCCCAPARWAARGWIPGSSLNLAQLIQHRPLAPWSTRPLSTPPPSGCPVRAGCTSFFFSWCALAALSFYSPFNPPPPPPSQSSSGPFLCRLLWIRHCFVFFFFFFFFTFCFFFSSSFDIAR